MKTLTDILDNVTIGDVEGLLVGIDVKDERAFSSKRIIKKTLKRCGLIKAKKIDFYKAGLAVAACLLLAVIGAGVLIPLLKGNTSVTDGPVQYVNYAVSPETLSGERFKGNIYTPKNQPVASMIPAWLRYGSSISVEAKVEAVLPDAYVSIDERRMTKYRILFLSVTEVIAGYNVADKIYYMLPEVYITDFTLYDSFIFALDLVGAENYLLINKTQGRIESFSYVFDSPDPFGGPIGGCIIPFSNGVIDTRIWQSEVWGGEGSAIRSFLADRYKYGFDVDKNSTIEKVKSEINEMLTHPEAYYNANPEIFTVPSLPENTHPDALAYLEYVKPFENGVYNTEWFYDTNGKCYIDVCRIVNGFRTRERARVDLITGEIAYSGESFTQEELSAMPDIGGYIAQLDIDSITPLHTPDFETLRRVGANASGWYTKVEGSVYGVVKIDFTYVDNSALRMFRDCTYVLFTPDGDVEIVEREHLASLIGNDSGIDTYTYGEGEEIPMF